MNPDDLQEMIANDLSPLGSCLFQRLGCESDSLNRPSNDRFRFEKSGL